MTTSTTRATGYEPLFIPKPFSDNVWIVDGPTIPFYGLPFSTRMTVIRLSSGELFCHSPIALTPQLADALSALGPVSYLVAPNWIHYAYVQQWADAFPRATTWVAPGVEARARKYNIPIRIDNELSSTPPATWSADLEQILISGGNIHHEVVFFHRSSRTLVLTDLIENLEGRTLPLWQRLLARAVGMLDPDGKAPIDIRLLFMGSRKALRRAVNTMITWDPEKIILAHGRCYESNGTDELKRAFRWAL